MGFEVKEFTNMGMKQDASPNKHEENFAFENHNIRITAVEDNTLLSVTNERGPKSLPITVTKKLKSNKIKLSKVDHQNNNIKVNLEYKSDVDLSVIIEYNLDGITTTFSGTLKKDEDTCTVYKPEGADLADVVLVTVHTKENSEYLFYSEDEGILPKYTYVPYELKGVYIGHCIINNYFVLFTTGDKDRIYKFKLVDDKFKGELLYEGDLNFDLNNPIETLPYYESEEVQKVYWVDGINQNRVINIADEFISYNTDLNFSPIVDSFPKMSVTTVYKGTGRFTSGVIQYFITYYNKYGAETKIVEQTKLINISPSNRGGKTNEHCDCSFEVSISNIDKKFDYLRVYSAQRTSLDGPLEVHIVKDIRIENNTVTVVDDNVNQQTVDSSLLHFIGGSDFVASTLCQKNDTLFMGGISIENTDISDEDKLNIKNATISEDANGCFNCDCVQVLSTIIEGANNVHQLSDKYINTTYLKAGEYYRLAIQYQDDKGSWSSPVWIGDVKHNRYPSVAPYGSLTDAQDCAYLPHAIFQYPQGLSVDSRYKKYRILRAKTDYNNRSTITQGILCPTMFNYEDRFNNTPFSIASWIMRPKDDSSIAHRHFEGVKPFSEIQSVNSSLKPPVIEGSTSQYDKYLSFVRLESEQSSEAILFLIPSESDPLATNIKDVVEISRFEVQDRDSTTYSYLSNWLYDNNVSIQFLISEEEFKRYEYYLYNRDVDTEEWTSGLDNGEGYNSSTGFPWDLVEGVASGYEYALVKVGPSSYIDDEVTEDVDNDVALKKDNFYVDNNIVTFHAPNIDSIGDIVDDKSLKFRVVGYADVDSYIVDSVLQTSSVGINKANTILTKRGKSPKALVASPMYKDYSFKSGSTTNYVSSYPSYYMVHLWNKTGSLSGWKADLNMTLDGQALNLTSTPSELKKKIFASYRILDYPKYVSHINYGNVDTCLYNSDEITVKALHYEDKTLYYCGNYDKLIADSEYRISNGSNTLVGPTQDSSIRIKYKSTPHIVFSLPNGKLLPRRADESIYSLSNIYNKNLSNCLTPWEIVHGIIINYNDTNQKVTKELNTNGTLFIGELYRDIPYNTLYGGTEENALEAISWIPASDITDINSNTTIYGDTYFGPWECLKTYPFTEEDENGVVDITKIYIESFTNLAGRSDINTDGSNMLNARPTNFNIFNDVYNQEDNIFTYYILDEKFNVNKFENQITWSLTKTPNDDVDSWTNATLSSVLNLDGSYGKITKLLNVNDNIIAFQDKAISTILYNERVQLSTESGLPVEIQNSGKVNGYQYVSNKTGCSNKYSIAESLSGVYYIDDHNKSFNRFGKDGVVDISALGMNIWFKKNDITSLRSYYDSITHDIYLVNNTTALLFNEDLKSFTSFMDYLGNTHIINLGGKSLIMGNEQSKFYEMFKGDYGIGLEGNTMDYSIEYVLNPEPMIDKTFTNAEFTADVFEPSSDIHSPYSQASNGIPFDKLSLWNDYQKGDLDLERALRGTLSKRFKSWRVQLPRDENSKYKHDRIRSPWVHLKLSKTGGKNTNKMVFNNLTVKYYK